MDKVIHCFALDPEGAKMREDGFYFKETRLKGWRITYEIKVVVVVPPIKKVINSAVMHSLKKMLTKRRESVGLFTQDTQLKYGLGNEDKEVICAHYVLDEKANIKREVVSIETARAKWIDNEAHDKIYMCDKLRNILHMIHQRERSKQHLDEKSKRWDKYENLSPDFHLTGMIMDLFDSTCRNTCRVNNIPYYHGTRGRVFVSHQGKGCFHRPMRDAIGLTNLMNLYHGLNNDEEKIITADNMQEICHNLGVKLRE